MLKMFINIHRPCPFQTKRHIQKASDRYWRGMATGTAQTVRHFSNLQLYIFCVVTVTDFGRQSISNNSEHLEQELLVRRQQN